ncbi:hypothetical protein YC2023_010618 [Brassica napus]
MAVYNRMPWMCAQRDNNNVQEKTTQNLLELIRPVRFYATVDSVLRVSGEINLPKEGSKVSMKPKGKIFDHRHKGGVRLESLESSKDAQEGKNESSAETDTLEMDKLQMMRLSGIVKTFKYTKEDAKTVTIQILNVVAFCHLQGVVHRDLKPEVNSLCTFKEDTSQLKAIYFGFSDYCEQVRSSQIYIIFHLIQKMKYLYIHYYPAPLTVLQANAESSTKDRLLLPVDRSDKVTCAHKATIIHRRTQAAYLVHHSYGDCGHTPS